MGILVLANLSEAVGLKFGCISGDESSLSDLEASAEELFALAANAILLLH